MTVTQWSSTISSWYLYSLWRRSSMIMRKFTKGRAAATKATKPTLEIVVSRVETMQWCRAGNESQAVWEHIIPCLKHKAYSNNTRNWLDRDLKLSDTVSHRRRSTAAVVPNSERQLGRDNSEEHSSRLVGLGLHLVGDRGLWTRKLVMCSAGKFRHTALFEFPFATLFCQ